MTLCLASQRVFIAVSYFVIDSDGNFWIHPRIYDNLLGEFNFGS
jgi:hypothetical protein